MNDHVTAIIVTYQPELAALDQLITSIRDQVHGIVLVDNSPDYGDIATRYTHGQVRYITMQGNAGIAAAQNAGIALARQQQASHVLLFDQDSIATPDMVAHLLAITQQVPDIASAGPCYLDTRQDNPPPFIRIEGLRLVRATCSINATVPVDYLIASGCLISMAVLDVVGAMRDDLFIDYVDIEWGLRAKRHGLQSYGVCNARMQHSLGDAPLRFMGKNIPLHSPLRHYYHFRNAVLLYRESWVPWNWKYVDGMRLCMKYVFYSLFARPRHLHWRMMTLGLWHGIKGKSGPLHKIAS
jgi:rhamnosyltransferase